MKVLNVAKREFHEPRVAEKVLEFDNGATINLSLKAGTVIEPHKSPCVVLVIVEYGEVVFNVEGDDVHLTQGSILYMDPNEVHGLKAVSDTNLIVVKIGGVTTCGK